MGKQFSAKQQVSKDGKIVMRRIDPHKNFGGNTITAVRRYRRNKWSITKQTITRTRLETIEFNGNVVTHPFEIRVLSEFDYKRLPNFNNPNFLHYLEMLWEKTVPLYILKLRRDGHKKRELQSVRQRALNLSITSYVSASEVLKLMREITHIASDGVERRVFNPEEVDRLVDRCDKAMLFGHDPYASHSVPYDATWIKALYESGGRPYPDDVTWDDVEAAIKNGF